MALSKSKIFPPMLLRMVSAGEATGKIDTMLEKMADFWDEEFEAMLDALTSWIEPMLIVFLGLIVGGIVISMILPLPKPTHVPSHGARPIVTAPVLASFVFKPFIAFAIFLIGMYWFIRS